MGIFRRLFGGKDEDATEQDAAETLTPESGTAEEAEEAEAGAVVAEAPAAEAVEIPKQQSAAVAADSEAGEGART
ncbi:gliding motility protein [Streptomyces sp. NPDC058655]|uniref:gliding motility protein n=1 Tax=Streptomyces sp. NPDC058655 TaxID=3346577 RepID=UPI00364E2F48